MLKNNTANGNKNGEQSDIKGKKEKNVEEAHTKNYLKGPWNGANIEENPRNQLTQSVSLVLLQSHFIGQQQYIIDLLLAKLSKFEKSESEDQELKNLNKHKKFIKIISAISFVLLIVVGITVMLIHYYNTFEENPEYTPAPGDDDNTYLGSHQVLDRTKWNGRPPVRYRNITSPVPLVIMKHTGGGMCYSFQECAGKMQTIQSQCVNNGAEDIYYNFLIGADGNIYVGRGWDVQPHQRDNIIDITFMGSFVFDKLTPTMIEAAKLLIIDGAEKNKLTKNYKIVCHNQTEPTESPGRNVIEEVRKWPHYDPGEYFTHNVLTSDRGN